jgi:hypothetical protein
MPVTHIQDTANRSQTLLLLEQGYDKRLQRTAL